MSLKVHNYGFYGCKATSEEEEDTVRDSTYQTVLETGMSQTMSENETAWIL